MEEILKSDIFFVTTTLMVVVVAILVVVLLIYLIRVIRDVKRISRRAREEVNQIADDIGFIRRNIKRGGHKIKKTVSKLVRK